MNRRDAMTTIASSSLAAAGVAAASELEAIVVIASRRFMSHLPFVAS